MATKNEQQLNEIQKKNLEAAMRLAQLSIENSQRIMELQVGTAKSLFEEGVANAKALSSVKDPAEAMNLRTAYAQSTTEKMLSCAREIAEITAKTQAEVGKMVSEQLTGGGADMFESIQKMFKGMPVGDHNALGTIQGAMDTARAAYEQMTKASTEAFQAFTKMGMKKESASSDPQNGASGRRFFSRCTALSGDRASARHAQPVLIKPSPSAPIIRPR